MFFFPLLIEAGHLMTVGLHLLQDAPLVNVMQEKATTTSAVLIGRLLLYPSTIRIRMITMEGLRIRELALNQMHHEGPNHG